jgi:hypothetical protein
MPVYSLHPHNPRRDMCEWDPEESQPARYIPGTDQHWGCPNDAEIIVGAKGQWRLCESCAALPEFKRFRKRKQIRQRVTNEDHDRRL